MASRVVEGEMAIGTGKKAVERLTAVRDKLWPDAKHELWNPRSEKGFTTIPRTLPLLMRLLDTLVKGKDLSRVYLHLWSRSYTHGVVEVRDPGKFAYASSFKGIRSWRERVELLQNLGFIRTAPLGDIQHYYITVRHPDAVIQELERKGKLHDDSWLQMYETELAEIGATRWSKSDKKAAGG